MKRERFRFKWPPTTEKIELVLEDRIFRKKLTGRDAGVGNSYDAAPARPAPRGCLVWVESCRRLHCFTD